MTRTSDRTGIRHDESTGSTTRTIDGADLRGAFLRANQVIADHRDQLNALNVFPVPDGDTGTNMTLTMRSALDALEKLADQPLQANRVASTFAFGALMGARGNSGVILSQILRGFANAVEDDATLTGEDVARGLDSATDVAYKAVLNPVEGTMLTVIADAAKAANASLEQSTAVDAVLVAAADGAEASLLRTPQTLEVLRKANVVDSGGQGVAYILRAMANHIVGDTSVIQIGDITPQPDLAAIDSDDPDHHDESGYCTNFVVTGYAGDADALREALRTVGTSMVVVGDQRALRVHIHTDRPDRALGIALDHGQIDNVAIQNMDTQIRERRGDVDVESRARVLDAEITGLHAIVAMSNGPGQTRVLLELGATSVVEVVGEAKPSTEEILRAVESAASDDVVVLPNSGDSIASAKLVIGLTDKRVEIVPSRSFVAGLQALAAAKQTSTLADNATAMSTALAEARHVEISRAVKDTEIDGIQVTSGDWVFISDGAVSQSNADLAVLAAAGFAGIGNEDLEIATIFLGKDADPAATAAVASAISAAFPDIAIEEVDGGQAFYPFIVGFE